MQSAVGVPIGVSVGPRALAIIIDAIILGTVEFPGGDHDGPSPLVMGEFQLSGYRINVVRMPSLFGKLRAAISAATPVHAHTFEYNLAASSSACDGLG